MVPVNNTNRISRNTTTRGTALRRGWMLLLSVLMAVGCIALPGTGGNVYAQYTNFQQLGNRQSIDLSAEPVSSTAVRLSWNINMPGVVGGIRIYRAHPVTPGNFVFLLNLPANALSYIDSGLKPGSTWIYRIQTSGRKPIQLSPPSNEVTVKLPASSPDEPATNLNPNGLPYTTTDPSIESPIQTLSAKAIGPNDIQLSWAIPKLPNVTSLRVFRTLATEPGNYALVGAVSSREKTYVDTNLQPNTTYLYQMKYNLDSHGVRLSPPSNTASARTLNGSAPDVRSKVTATRPKPGIPFVLPPTFGYSNALPLDELENEMLYQLNKYRTANGVGPVLPSIKLTNASNEFGKELAASGSGAPRSKMDSQGRTTYLRARAAGYDVQTKYDTIISVAKARSTQEISQVLEEMKGGMGNSEILLDPSWKIVGISQNYSESDGANRWVLDFAAFWDVTIPLPGEDTDGRIDGNEKVRTRPPSDALALKDTFTGYGDDGRPYSTTHCDTATNECWKDPVLNLGRSLDEASLPENMIGDWHVAYQVTQNGAWHFNDTDRFDTTEFTMSLRINEDGTWISQGYRAFQTPTPVEAGTWKWVHDPGRNEEIVTFYRDGRPSATLRVHAAPGEMTIFAVDGGAATLNFFLGVAGDTNPKNDPQVIFKPGLMTFSDPFPGALKCQMCPPPTGL